MFSENTTNCIVRLIKENPKFIYYSCALGKCDCNTGHICEKSGLDNSGTLPCCETCVFRAKFTTYQEYASYLLAGLVATVNDSDQVLLKNRLYDIRFLTKYLLNEVSQRFYLTFHSTKEDDYFFTHASTKDWIDLLTFIRGIK